jgi:hypothetical protein
VVCSEEEKRGEESECPEWWRGERWEERIKAAGKAKELESEEVWKELESEEVWKEASEYIS